MSLKIQRNLRSFIFLHTDWRSRLRNVDAKWSQIYLNLSDVLASTLWPHHWRPCSPPLAAWTTTGRIYKVAVMSFRALNGLSPPYLDQIVQVSDLPGRHRLRSSSSHRLQVLAYRLATVGRCSFSVAASRSTLWNSLPPDIQSLSAQTDFCHRLKTLPPIIPRHLP